jgi:MSHA biogenesis protein MshP
MKALFLRSRSEGFALMMAVFLIVTLAAIGTYLMTISIGQTEATSQDEQGARAYQAARAGVEWAAYQILRKTKECSDVGAPLVLQQGLTGYFATVSCVSSSETEAAVAVKIYTLTVTGCNRNPCGPANTGPTYVERQLQLTLSR